MLRKPIHPEIMYADFDGFFASVEQFLNPGLRGKPVGITPMISGSSCVIAVSREAKALGVGNVMRLAEARAACPDLIFWPQHPDMYRRAHHELMSEISMVAPIDTIKSIDEMCCRLGANQVGDPEAVGREIKRRIAAVFGPWISISCGYAPNRLLAKMACKAGKPAGNLVWHPRNIYQHLMSHELSDIPGVGPGILARLEKSGVKTVEKLLDLSPRHMRAIWGSLIGERMHYALHGYDISAGATNRGMFGHSRMLPPSNRLLPMVEPMSRLLTVKATRRMRREGFRAGVVSLGLVMMTRHGHDYWSRSHDLPAVADYRGILDGLADLWRQARRDIDPRLKALRTDACLGDLTPMAGRQMDLLAGDEAFRLRQEALSDAIDRLNHRYCGTVVYPGMRDDVPADNVGMKIAYGRIPRIEDGF